MPHGKIHSRRKSAQAFITTVGAWMKATLTKLPRLRHRSHSDAVQGQDTELNGLVTGPRGDLCPRPPNKPPIHDLPLEVLGMIFILALPNDAEYIKGKRRFLPPLPNPLSFCAVCTLWRSFTLATPQLWKRVFVYVPFGISGAEARSKAGDLVLWIERSLSLPLTLFISYGIDASLVELGPEAPIVHVLNRYATRWETLYLQYTGSCPQFVSESSSRLFSFAQWISLQRIYSLRRYSGPERDAPWGQLTHLRISRDLSYQDAMDILNGCPKLKQLSICIKSRWSFESPASSPIILYDLSFISLTADDACISAVIQSICLPSLQDMAAHILTPLQRPIDLVSTLHFLTRSACTLQKLEISTSRGQSEDLVRLLAHPSCNSLTSLTINDCWFSDYGIVDEEVLRRLTLHQDDTLCTRLKSLTLKRCIQPRSFPALLSMVESRTCSHAGLPPLGLLRYLNLEVKDVDEVEAKLMEIIERSGMQYDGREIFLVFARFY